MNKASKPWGQVVAICRALHDDTETTAASPREAARAIAPELFSESTEPLLDKIQTELVDAVYALGKLDDQGAYEAAHATLHTAVVEAEGLVRKQRFLGGEAPCAADYLLFAFCVRLDLVYFELYKATVGLLADFPCLQDHARDLYERPEVFETTDFDRIRADHYTDEPVLNPKGVLPRGGAPDLDGPQDRALQFAGEHEDGTEESQDAKRGAGEWVRGVSKQRNWISAGSEVYPAVAGRYHLYAPYNCPWSHRALLARAVKGLDEVVDASIVYFRRDGERGWQFNPAIPGCTEDRAGGRRYVVELYESVDSKERSVPVLWDTVSETIVCNESADILRMFNSAFGELAVHPLDLYPARFGHEIDRINAHVYQRINNGAYKAGFSGSQAAYDRAFARYFRTLDWLETLLIEREWLAGSPEATEADLRLFPTVFRHDAVYYARFKLNLRRISDYPLLSDWLSRMLEVPGVREASNLDHARNGYFGRSGNELVPAGPVPLTLSSKDFTRDVWQNA